MRSVVKEGVSRVGRRVYERRRVELESRARGKIVAIIDEKNIIVAETLEEAAEKVMKVGKPAYFRRVGKPEYIDIVEWSM